MPEAIQLAKVGLKSINRYQIDEWESIMRLLYGESINNHYSIKSFFSVLLNISQCQWVSEMGKIHDIVS